MQWHLLEHAFETTLEAGDIPHPLLFSEMVCQAMFRDDYEKAAKIVNSMAHAPFQLNEKDWTGLFEKNKDRISDEHLKKLSTTICESDMPDESTSSELLKALQNINERNVFYIAGDNKELLSDDDFEQNKLSVGRSCDEKRKFDFDEDDRASSCSKSSSFIDVVSDESACLGEEFLHAHSQGEDTFDEILQSDASDSDISDSDEPELPSADEILQYWKKIRRKDGHAF